MDQNDQILTSLETPIFGPPRPWGVEIRIVEGRFPGVAKILTRFDPIRREFWAIFIFAEYLL